VHIDTFIVQSKTNVIIVLLNNLNDNSIGMVSYVGYDLLFFCESEIGSVNELNCKLNCKYCKTGRLLEHKQFNKLTITINSNFESIFFLVYAYWQSWLWRMEFIKIFAL